MRNTPKVVCQGCASTDIFTLRGSNTYVCIICKTSTTLLPPPTRTNNRVLFTGCRRCHSTRIVPLLIGEEEAIMECIDCGMEQ